MATGSMFVSGLQIGGMAMRRMSNGHAQVSGALAVFRAGLLACLMLSLAGCDMFGFRSWSWHQKLTVTVDTPEGPRSGSAVSAAWFQMTPKWSGVGDSAGASNSSLSGEAVVVDLGQGAVSFSALLKGYTEFTGRLAFFPPAAKAAQQRKKTPGCLRPARSPARFDRAVTRALSAPGHLRRHHRPLRALSASIPMTSQPTSAPATRSPRSSLRSPTSR